MDKEEILSGLNDKQKEAVMQTEGPCLVIAGAGSGKTKVLTHKIAYEIANGVKPWNILAITFTNKAANEMKERIGNLIGEASADLWMGTFHSICVRILRKFIDRIGFNTDFVIFDTSDQRTLIKECLKTLKIDDKLFTDRGTLSEISNAKNEMLEPKAYSVKYSGDFRKEKIAQIYALYQQRLKENNAIDFDDIINFTIKILNENADILDYYTEKFKYVLVDEYQDTNKAQFTLVSLFASKYGNVTAVGDNDQGIYSFRGADITNILNFERDFPGTKIIKLEQNYRCTGNILKAANAVIKNNEVKYKKELWTNNEVGQLPKIYSAKNEYDEGSFIVQEINRLKREEYFKYSDFAVLYRMNTQSRAIEDIFNREGIGEVTNDNAWDESCTRNQWVWVPVPDVSRIYETDSSGKKKSKLYNFSATGRTSYTNSNYEPGVLSNSDNEKYFAQYGLQGMTQKRFLNELQNEFDETIKSIEKYGGFYIGRYETGNLTSDEPVVQRMNTSIASQNWYTAYTRIKRMSTGTNVRTGMIWGSLWDETLQWLVDSGNKTYAEMKDSTSWGNYANSTFEYKTNTNGSTTTESTSSSTRIPSESTEYSKANNIYDMAGNVCDWTLEGNGSTTRRLRGGSFGTDGSYFPASSRYDKLAVYGYYDSGYRAYFNIE